MAGKKGGVLDSVGNATGLNEVVGGSAKYILGGGLQAVYENTIKPMNEAKRGAKKERQRQEQLQVENERAMADQKNIQNKGVELRAARARQRAIAAAVGGRNSTILTPPGASLGAAPMTDVGSKKTLLGE